MPTISNPSTITVLAVVAVSQLPLSSGQTNKGEVFSAHVKHRHEQC